MRFDGPSSLSKSYSWAVHRTRALPTAPVRGIFLITEGVVVATIKAMVGFALDGIREGGHEGIAFWAGRELGTATVFLKCIVPRADHGPNGVFVDELAVGQMSRAARADKLGVLTQVHSHPGTDTRHSDGDDDLIVMPFEGMLSIVVPNFGIGVKTLYECGVHQFQDGRWVLCEPESIRVCMFVVNSVEELQ